MKKSIIIILLMLAAMIACGTSTAVSAKGSGDRQYIWRLTLRDKQGSSYTLEHPGRWLSHKSIERRRRQGLTLDSTDLPVSGRYLRAIERTHGIEVVGCSRWNNTVLVRSNDTTALRQAAALEFVKHTRMVWQTPDSVEHKRRKVRVHERWNAWDSIPGEPYGGGKNQIEMLKGDALHQQGLRGRGMTIAVMDGGFQNCDEIESLRRAHIVGVKDFVIPPSTMFYRETDHGTKVLSVMAMDVTQVLVGTAPSARYWLLRCEDQKSEQPIEEDYWAMAAEYADSAGVDIINSSVGYNEYDAPHRSIRLNELDGRSTLISRTASMLAGKGIVLVNSAGNTGMSPWKKICVPADADEILTVGALTDLERNASFSSIGPTQDGRVKPDVMALGAPAVIVSGSGAVERGMGTSFSTPVVTGLVACMWQSCPWATARQVIEAVRQSGDNYTTPNNIFGYGKPDFQKALELLQRMKTTEE